MTITSKRILLTGKICGDQFEWHIAPLPDDTRITQRQAEECSGAYVIGEMDSDDCLPCQPLQHFSEPAMIESYILGWNDAHAHAGTLQRLIDEGEQTAELEDWLLDEEWLRSGC